MKVPILHLHDGAHQFDETVISSDLDMAPDSVFRHPIQIKAVLNRYEKNIQCSVAVQTKVTHQCDRCLDEFEEPLDLQFEFLIYMGDGEVLSEEEDVLQISNDVQEVDLSERIREQLLLTIPMKILCREDCEGLCAGCGVALAEEACSCEKEVIDPRWAKLKELKEKVKDQ